MIAVRIKLTPEQQEAIEPILQLLREKHAETGEYNCATVGQLDVCGPEDEPAKMEALSAWFTVLEPDRSQRVRNAVMPRKGESKMHMVRDMMADDVFAVMVGGDIWEREE